MNAEQFRDWMDAMGWSRARAARELGIHPNTAGLYAKEGAPSVIGLACLALYHRLKMRRDHTWNP